MLDKILNYLRNEFSSKAYRALTGFKENGTLGIIAINGVSRKSEYSPQELREMELLSNNGCMSLGRTIVPGFSLKDVLDGKKVERKPDVALDQYFWTPKGRSRYNLLKRLRFLLG